MDPEAIITNMKAEEGIWLAMKETRRMSVIGNWDYIYCHSYQCISGVDIDASIASKGVVLRPFLNMYIQVTRTSRVDEPLYPPFTLR